MVYIRSEYLATYSMSDTLNAEFRRLAASLKFNGNQRVAKQWMEWENANKPTLRDYFVRLLHTLWETRPWR